MTNLIFGVVSAGYLITGLILAPWLERVVSWAIPGWRADNGIGWILLVAGIFPLYLIILALGLWARLVIGTTHLVRNATKKHTFHNPYGIYIRRVIK